VSDGLVNPMRRKEASDDAHTHTHTFLYYIVRLFRNVGTLGCGTIGLWEHRAVGLSGCGNIGLWEHRAVGPLGCGTIGLWDHRAVGT